MNDINILGVDIAKDVFQLHEVNKEGKVMLRKRLNRKNFGSSIVSVKP